MHPISVLGGYIPGASSIAVKVVFSGDLGVVKICLGFIAEVGDRVEEGKSHVGAGHSGFSFWEEVAVRVREAGFWIH